jgi:hypothetical protein
VVETLDRAHADRLMIALRAAGYRVALVPLDHDAPA